MLNIRNTIIPLINNFIFFTERIKQNMETKLITAPLVSAFQYFLSIKIVIAKQNTIRAYLIFFMWLSVNSFINAIGCTSCYPTIESPHNTHGT